MASEGTCSYCGRRYVGDICPWCWHRAYPRLFCQGCVACFESRN